MSKYNNMINDTMQVIAGDLQTSFESMGESLSAENLAEASFDYVDIHGRDEELASEFHELGYEKMMEIALPIARRLI